MNIGWIFLGCALAILAFMAFTPWRKKERVDILGESVPGTQRQHVLSRTDDFDTRLVRRDEIIRLLWAGRKIEAIKMYRTDTEASLADAKAAVERLELAAYTDLGTPDEGQTPAVPAEVLAPLKREVETLLMNGKKIGAIKLYREQTGLSLRAAKEMVDQIEQELFLQAPTSSPFPGDGGSEGGSWAAEEPDEKVRRCVQEGRKIEAIKLYREQTGLSLRAAKEVVDQIEQELFLQAPTSSPFPRDGGSEGDSRAAEEPGEKVRRCVQEGRKIEAIKLYREQTGLSLRAAKEAIDRLEQAQHQGMEQS